MIIVDKSDEIALGEDYERVSANVDICAEYGYTDETLTNRFICTRRNMHKGMHAAHVNDHVVALWKD